MLSEHWLGRYRDVKNEYVTSKDNIYKLFDELRKQVYNCPFCGSKTYLSIDENKDGYYYAKIKCQNYDCDITKKGYSYRNIHDAELDAYRIVNTWNRRVNSENNEGK